jgi:hypothetical protein
MSWKKCCFNHFLFTFTFHSIRIIHESIISKYTIFYQIKKINLNFTLQFIKYYIRCIKFNNLTILRIYRFITIQIFILWILYTRISMNFTFINIYHKYLWFFIFIWINLWICILNTIIIIHYIHFKILGNYFYYLYCVIGIGVYIMECF